MKGNKPVIAIIGESFSVGGAERMTVDMANALNEEYYTHLVLTISDKGVNKAHLNKKIDYKLTASAKNLVGALTYVQHDMVIFNNCRSVLKVLDELNNHPKRPKTIVSMVHGSNKLSLDLIPDHPCIDRVLTVSDKARIGIEKHLPYWAGKIDVIQNYVDSSLFKPVNRNNLDVEIDGWSRDSKILGYCGRFSGEKSLISLVTILNKLKSIDQSWKLLMIGGIDEDVDVFLDYWKKEKASVENMINQYGLGDDVLITDSVEDPENYYPLIDVFALTSCYEGSLLVIQEAMACGLPVVSTNVGDAEEVIYGANCGYIVDKKKQDLDDVETNQFVSLVIESYKNKKMFGENARGWIVKNRSIDSFDKNIKEYILNPNIFKGEKKENKTKRSKPNSVCLIPDQPGWAFDRISNLIKSKLSHKYNFKISYLQDLIRNNTKEDRGILFWYNSINGNVINKKDSIPCIYDGVSWGDLDISNLANSAKAIAVANKKLKKIVLKNKDVIKNKTKIFEIQDGVDTSVFYSNKTKNKKQKIQVGWTGNSKLKFKNTDVKGFWIIQKAMSLTSDIADWHIVDRDVNGIPFDKMPEWYNGLDIITCMSTEEGTPNPLLEGLACGCLPVMTNVGLAQELIDDGCQIEIIERSVDSLVSKIKHISKNKSLIHCAKDKNIPIVKEKWDWNIRIKNWEKVIDFYLDNKKEPLERKHKTDLSNDVTVFVTTIGAVDYKHCIECLENQDCKFNIEVIKNVSPMNAAFQKMIDNCKTKYYIQVDEDMMLYPHAVRTMHDRILKEPDTTAILVHGLHDVFIDMNITGVKIYKHSIIKKFPYSVNGFSCETDQLKKLNNSGFGIKFYYNGLINTIDDTVMGDLNEHWDQWGVFEKYSRDMQKLKRDPDNQGWMSMLLPIFIDKIKCGYDNIALYAILGAIVGLASPLLKDKEKDFTRPEFLPVFNLLKEILKNNFNENVSLKIKNIKRNIGNL